MQTPKMEKERCQRQLLSHFPVRLRCESERNVGTVIFIGKVLRKQPRAHLLIQKQSTCFYSI